MIRYLKTHGWLVALALAGALALGAGCGSDDASNADRDDGASSSGFSDELQSEGGEKAEARNGAVVASDIDSFESDSPAGTIAGEPAPGGAPGALQQALDRKIIHTATLTVSTEDVAKRFQDVGNIAAGAGGFIASSSFGNSGERQTASITIRVPNESYQSVLNQLRQLGEVKGEQSGTNDVTGEYTDLQSRLRNLRATEEQYVQFLLRAQNINEVLTVQDRLNITRGEIEQVQGRINLLDNQTDLATVTVHLDPPLVQKEEPKTDDGISNPAEAAEVAWENSLVVLTGIATVAVAVIAFSWWLLPVAAGVIWFMRRQMRTMRERQVMAAAPPAAPAPAP